MISELLAISAGIISVITGIINTKLSKEKTQAELEMKIRSKALDFAEFIREWDETHKDIQELLETTEIDRFIMFRAWNGFAEPKWTTSMLQVRQGNQTPINYIHFELDEDYQERLKFCQLNKHSYFEIDTIPNDASIKKVYSCEEINASLWSHVIDIDGPQNSKILIYTSLSTINHKTISQKTILKCKSLIEQIKLRAHEYQISQNVISDEIETAKKIPFWKFWKK